jgi:hypothetical protein
MSDTDTNKIRSYHTGEEGREKAARYLEGLVERVRAGTVPGLAVLELDNDQRGPVVLHIVLGEKTDPVPCDEEGLHSLIDTCFQAPLNIYEAGKRAGVFTDVFTDATPVGEADA